MNIVMFTNTYLPHVGGVARSVEAFSQAIRRAGHRVLIVAPEFDTQPANERNVVRVPAFQRFNGSDFSVALPDLGAIDEALDDFAPDLAHSHHPFLLGNTAVRTARARSLPLVFTHHTLYEQYTHYVPADSPALKRFAIALASCYANLCDHVIAPSESIEALLRARGVTSPITTVPTGVDVARFANGDGSAVRARVGIPADAFVVGHVGRLAPEKNLEYLTAAMIAFLRTTPAAHCLLVGTGPSEDGIVASFDHAGLRSRLHQVGVLGPPDLVNAYHAMDVFAFASCSETQGMVLTESMAAGVPVVALEAPGAREIVTDGMNGRLLGAVSAAEFGAALAWVADLPPVDRARLRACCLVTAHEFSIEQCAARLLGVYQGLVGRGHAGSRHPDDGGWQRAVHAFNAEWDLLGAQAQAFGAAIGLDDDLTTK
jgi:1,2-diacylglycerol 3-alpha-glucosyltransferase